MEICTDAFFSKICSLLQEVCQPQRKTATERTAATINTDSCSKEQREQQRQQKNLWSSLPSAFFSFSTNSSFQAGKQLNEETIGVFDCLLESSNCHYIKFCN